MRTAHILDMLGMVTNSIVVTDDTDLAEFDAVLGPDGIGIGWMFDGDEWSPPARPTLSLGDLREHKLTKITAAAGAILVAGAPVAEGLHVALDDSSRVNLSTMAAIATAALAGAISWPESYSRGWIAIENVRVPLATPADGLELAASVGDWYGAVIQHARDLKDAALAAEDAATLDAIDVDAGWPV